MTPPLTNFQVYAQSNGGRLTRGVLVAALLGLRQYADDYDYLNKQPIVFQINDGESGEVGIGFVGIIDPNDAKRRCIYEMVQGKAKYCQDVTLGKVIS